MREITMENLREMGLTRLRSPDEPVDILSGGERQALAIARARYFGGSLLLLDEPTSALSVKETEKVSEAVQIARNERPRRRHHRSQHRTCAPDLRPHRHHGGAAG